MNPTHHNRSISNCTSPKLPFNSFAPTKRTSRNIGSPVVNLAAAKTTLCRAYLACGLARLLRVAAVCVPYLALCGGAAAAEVSAYAIGRALLAAYPDFLERIDGNELVWKDGTR